MPNSTRRKELLQTLSKADAPLSGTALGKQLGVSRQIIVQDIAILRTSGHEITSTHKGYVYAVSPMHPRRLVKVRHTPDQMEQELTLVVDLGGCVEDVMVNHRTYAKLQAPLNIKNRRDMRRFLDEIESGVSSPLSTVTSGYHFHHISAESEDVLDEIVAALDAQGFLAEFTEFEATSGLASQAD